jgi:hypothetical protein
MSIAAALPEIFNKYKLLIDNILDFHFVSVHWYLNKQDYVLVDTNQVKTSFLFFQNDFYFLKGNRPSFNLEKKYVFD